MPPEFTLPAYQEFIFSLQERFASINYAKVTLKMRSANSGLLLASIFFDLDIRLEVLEDLDFAADHPIRKYSYEVWRGADKLYWYDSQPHPDDPGLSSTDPHHKHVPPDIKHNRIPAPDLSFAQPNLPFLINEIEKDLLGVEPSQANLPR